MPSNRGGFTLVELLVVISIISVLASTVLASLSQSREKSKVAKAQQELTELRNAIYLLIDDTGKGPGGCPIGVDTDLEIALNDDQNKDGIVDTNPYGGLLNMPSTTGNICQTTGADSYCWGSYQGVDDPLPPPINPRCIWTEADLLKWKGPYTRTGKDPWGNSYWYDPDYHSVPSDPENPQGGCSGQGLLRQALVSFGPNGVQNYPCASGPHDDAVIEILYSPPER